MSKQRKKTLDCAQCPDCCPAPQGNNIVFLNFWQKVSRCWHYVGTMEGIYPVSLNWVDVETLARLNHIKLNSMMLAKLNIAERKSIEESNKKR